MKKSILILPLLLIIVISLFTINKEAKGKKQDNLRHDEALALRFELEVTMEDLKSITRAIRSYTFDLKHAPKANSIKELAEIIQPFYIKTCPLTDIWGGELLYKHDLQNPGNYWLASPGSDGKFSGFNREGTWDIHSDRGHDIIVFNNEFVYRPKMEKSTQAKVNEKSENQVEKEKLAIKKVIEEAYIKGAIIKRDEKIIRDFFHKDCDFIDYRFITTKRRSLDEWIKYINLPPKGVPGIKNLRHEISSLTVTGYAATAILRLHSGNILVGVDHLSLYKLKNGWKIVNSIIYTPAYKMPKNRKTIKVDPGILDAYCGRYAMDPKFYFTVKKMKDHLFVEVVDQGYEYNLGNLPPVEIFPETPITFFVKEFDATYTFVKDINGKVSKLIYRWGEMVIIVRRQEPKISIFPRKESKMTIKKWEIRKVISGPFATEKEALQGYGGQLPGNLEIAATDAQRLEKGYYILKKGALLSEKDVEGVSMVKDPRGNPGLCFTFTPAGTDKLKKYTSANIEKKLAYLLDNKVVLVPAIQGTHRYGHLIGKFTRQEIRDFCSEFRTAKSKKITFILKELKIQPLVEGPFKTKEKALEKYGDRAGKDVLIMKTDPQRMGKNYFVLKKDVIVSIKDFREVRRARDGSGNPAIGFSFNDRGANRLKVHASANIGKQVAVILNNKIANVIKIGSTISYGRILGTRILGTFTEKEVDDIIIQLKFAISKQKE